MTASIPRARPTPMTPPTAACGTALFCLGQRVDGLHLVGVELQSAYAVLARRNAERNGISADIRDSDLSALPTDINQRQFDFVIANPPYFDRDASTAATDQGRETAMGEATPLQVWVDVAVKRLKPSGYAHFIHRAERLPDLLAEMSGRLGSLEVLPLLPRAGRPARLVLVRGRKGGRAAFRLLAGRVMHEGVSHDGDRESYTPEIRSVLRDGAALSFC